MDKKTLLAVDDAEINRKILSKLFSNEFDVLEACNGKEAIDVLNKKEGNVDIIILDIIMPDYDGFYFLEKIKATDYADVPVVISTTDTSPEAEERLLDLGATDLIYKPFNPQNAVKKVKAILARHEAENQKIKITASSLEERHTIVMRQTNTFSAEYDFVTKKISIDPEYSSYVHRDFCNIDISDPSTMIGLIYRPDLDAVVSFLNVGEIRETTQRYINIRILTNNNIYEWFRLALTVHIEDSVKTKAIITFNNINSEMEAIKKLEIFSSVDRLTKIPNRNTFVEKTQGIIEENKDTKFAIVRFDIESFKIINQLFGTYEGDSILKFIAVKLQEIIEPIKNGTYCRITSDLFAFSIPYENEDLLTSVIDTLVAAVKMYPLNFDITLSFGIYIAENSEYSVRHMLDRAGVAQKSTKNNYKTHISYFDEALREQEEIEITIVSEMKRALENGEFKIYLQPKCDMRTGKIIGSEALVRWLHPEKGLISPRSFIPIFENNGFITELDYYIFETVSKQLNEWRNDGVPILPVSVNVSRADLYDPYLFPNIVKIVDKYNIPHEYIEFELTESSFISDNHKLVELTYNLQKAGFHVLMDDFGSGYSSLNSLKDIKVDVLKIDINFLPTSTSDERASKILASVVSMANALDLKVVVEGVETREQADFLISIGAYEAQGYYFFRPMPVEDYEKALKAQFEASQK
ncbi:MAG: EAL domain-containing protein [Ruminococcaceae bacterium]|nr:EAL domain-containing protein [Oscillospiraceae bacterium]